MSDRNDLDMKDIVEKIPIDAARDQEIDVSSGDLATGDHTAHWPLLMKNFSRMKVKDSDWTPQTRGCEPLQRSMQDLMQLGVMNLDKSANPSSHEVVSWVKRIIECNKTGHSGTLDPQVTGCLIVCINNATRLVKAQQGAGKEYVCVIRLHDKIPGGEASLRKAIETLTGALLQRPPVISAVKRVLRVRAVTECKLIEFDNDRHLGVFWVSCEAGTYIRTLCQHIGILLGVGAHMQELRRVRSGAFTEKERLYTLHDLLDAFWMWKHQNNESYLRAIIQPIEAICTQWKRIFLKDSAVASICYGAFLTSKGIACYDPTILAGEEVALVTFKGEMVALAVATMNAASIMHHDHGQTVKLKRVVMDRNTYERAWGKGPHAMQVKQMRASGLLDKNGRPNGKTPQDHLDNYTYIIDGEEVKASSLKYDEKPTEATSPAATPVEKKSKHEGETPEEREARRARKAEKKAKLAAKAEKKSAKRARTDSSP